jgi:serine/threonine-protein kinase
LETTSSGFGNWRTSRSLLTALPLLGGGRARPLADDLLAEAARRLQILAVVMIGLWFVDVLWGLTLVKALRGTPFAHLLPEELGAVHVLVIAGGLALSVAVLLVARSGRLEPERLLDLGLVYMVLMAMLVAAVQTAETVRGAGQNGLHVSWVCIWILLYPAIVPNTPRKILIASLLAAVMDPLAINAFALAEYGRTAPAVIWLLYVPSYVCAFLAVLPARIVVRLREKVEQARELGSYHLEKMLGRGGMGEVWRARHRLLARPAAVKIIRSDTVGAASPEDARAVLRRFEREAQATAALRSPHTVQVFDFGLGRDGTFYYVMEMLDGLDLDSLVRRFGPLPAARVRHLLVQACHSLYDAHRSGLIHRDVKPANLFACRMGQDCDFVKVLDFGLVKAATQSTGADTLATAGQVATGTPATMAPEQIVVSRPQDHRLDLYALGCVAYWLLTGQLVFDTGSNLEMLVKHAKEDPVPPSRRTELPIPPDLERVVLQCLEKDPDRRPADARELARLLRACAIPDTWDGDAAREWWGIHLPAREPSAAC